MVAKTATQAEHAAFEQEIQACNLQETLADFRQQVIRWGDRFSQASGIMGAIKHQAMQALSQATTIQAVNTVVASFPAQLDVALSRVIVDA